MSVFEQIRKSCERVALNAKHVKIKHNLIESYLLSLPLKTGTELIMDTENHFCGSEEETVNYFVVLDCINFGSGFFEYLEKSSDKSGYFTVASLLKQEFIAQSGLNCDFLKGLTAKDCTRIFRQSATNSDIQILMKMFADALNELGAYVSTKFSGSFIKLVKSAGYSASALVENLAKMKHYKDYSNHPGGTVYFFKRAQITVSDLNIALNGKGAGHFTDIEDLTIFADNLVPHVLWLDGILEYSPELSQRIAANELIMSDSDEELELRACAVHAVELLRHQASSMKMNFTSQQLDYLLWNRGQAPLYRSIPPHSTRSYFY